ncbi:SIR2 family NAD-dependent protein deacylase (plasmid) [Agrobacterium rosae]|uniref:SIR2 family protein n=1 Tax=Agrobacterium rosae TaxID=1972867 RepID=A0ABU4W303_9HYPH|nr:SIR2 family protein [Agrobacterium rosae]MDX8332170.1 SIR2 family protein [Agrobacterium rosae]
MKFHPNGPDFPEALINDLLEGDVVFLCGAGVSAPQLPNFRDLVLNVYIRLGEDRNPAENQAFETNRYEEVLGALSRRLVRPDDVIEAAAAELQTPAAPDVSHHDVILRLSRDKVGRAVIVTTNFDTLFERSLMQSRSPAEATDESAAGQDIPAPGSARFKGIVHLHGRLADPQLNLSQTELVLTSAQYGEAYLRAGWAARFLFDLMRCRTLVLVGYTANDAPVRYILNVLEGDRERFSDLRRVYALSSSNGDAELAAAPWQALAVEPLLFNPEPQDGYGPLWNSLSGLADLVENPDVRRRAIIVAIAASLVEETTEHDIRALRWALSARVDLFEHFVEHCEDATWFETFAVEIRAFGERARAWMLGRWFARNWCDRRRYLAAVGYLQRDSRHLSEALFRELDRNPPGHAVWEKAWRLLAEAASRPQHDSLLNYQLRHRLNGAFIPETDLGRLVDAIGPRLAIEAPFRDEDPVDDPSQISDIARFSMEGERQEFLDDVLQSPVAQGPKVSRLLTRASEALASQLRTARDAELIGETRDLTDWSVPSVVRHQQNRHRRGFVPLTELITAVLPIAAQVDAPATKRVVCAWRLEPFNLTTRLWMYGLTQADLFGSDEAIENLVTSGDMAFWSFAQEFVVITQARLAEASDAVVERLVQRVIAEGPQRYSDRPPSADDIDWQARARDRDMWLRLTAIAQRSVLPQPAGTILADILARRPYLSRELDDQDLFRSWSSGVRSVRGRTTRLVSAQPNERLTIAEHLEESSDIEDREGWAEYCREDPVGAFEALQGHALEASVVQRWVSWLEVVGRRFETTNPDTMQLVQNAIHLIAAAEPAFFSALVSPLAQITDRREAVQLVFPDNWWDRLWQAAEGEEYVEWNENVGLYDRVINSTGGSLAESLLQALSRQQDSDGVAEPADLVRLRRMVLSPTYAGAMARGACVRYLTFVFGIDRDAAAEYLRPYLAADDEEGSRLRAVLVEYNSFTAEAEIAFSDLILRAIRESREKDISAANTASHLIRAVLAPLVEPNELRGISPQQARLSLRETTADVRVGALRIMASWLEEYPPAERGDVWNNLYGPAFRAIWPRDRRFLSDDVSKEIFGLATATGDAFAAAVETLLPYVSTFGGDWISLHDLERDGAELASRFPVDALKLVWAACGPPCRGRASDITTILDAIAVANPSLAVDRRVHKLRLLAVSH